MTILLPAVAVVFGEFCVWLTVRIANRRERWAKWTAVSIVAAACYPFSLGPAIWLDRSGVLPDWEWIGSIYTPLRWVYDIGPDQFWESIDFWIDLWRPD